MTDKREDKPERCRSRSIEGEEGMSGATTKQCAGFVPGEPTSDHRLATSQADGAEARHAKRMRWNADWSENVLEERVRIVEKRLHQSLPRTRVWPQSLTGRGNGPMQDRGGAVIEGMGKGRSRMHPFQAEVVQGKAPQQRRHQSHGVNGRADIMMEAGKRYLGGAAPATDDLIGFEHEHRSTGLGKDHGGGESVRPRAHDYHVVRRHLEMIICAY
jgi:hypothetical protein